MSAHIISVSSFYKFLPIAEEDLAVKKLSLESRAAKLNIDGLIILAKEGVNGTISGNWDDVLNFEKGLAVVFSASEWHFKKARCVKPPFQDFRVKVRTEIVTTRQDRPLTVTGEARKLSPSEWHSVLSGKEDFVLLDTRNAYETSLGMFRNAVDPKIENFSDFPAYVESCRIPKEKKILMYCTGGIRCEKAALEMERQGYEKVFQLAGGILSYLEEFPHQHFEGQCFVFDGRVAVDQNLNPTKVWKFCPHCGQPAKQEISCDFCGESAVVCEGCIAEPQNRTCSHDCSYKVLHHPSRKARTVVPSNLEGIDSRKKLSVG